MEIRIEKDDKSTAIKIVVIGRVDSITSTELERVINETIKNTKEIIIDCNELNYVSSACLRVLLQSQRKLGRGGKLKLVGVNENVMDVFKITGFDSILSIEEKI